MTSRERLLSAVRGGTVDKKPKICWPISGTDSDVQLTAGQEQKVHLVEVANPFGIAMMRSLDLNALLKIDPKAGNDVLTELCEESTRSIDTAFASGADGVIYTLYGARARHCTPMQYGGFYLEKDREILSRISEAFFNMVFVVGDEDVYLDFVSDLPAHALAWDITSSRISVEDVRLMRSGALACDDPAADILLEPGTSLLSQKLEDNVRPERSYAV